MYSFVLLFFFYRFLVFESPSISVFNNGVYMLPGSRCQLRFTNLFVRNALNALNFRDGAPSSHFLHNFCAFLSHFLHNFQQLFSAFLTKFQHFSAHISALLCKVFALNFLKIERVSAHFLYNFWIFSRTGFKPKNCDKFYCAPRQRKVYSAKKISQ